MSTLLELAATAAAGIAVGMTARYYWLTRRQPVRKDAPTGDKPWVHPDPFWND